MVGTELIDRTAIDKKGAALLEILSENDGHADTTTIRELGGLSRQEVRWRYEKLEREGLIETKVTTRSEDSRQVTVAHLTDVGREAIDDGLLEEVGVIHENITDLGAQVRNLKTRVNKLESERLRLRLKVDSLEKRLDNEL